MATRQEIQIAQDLIKFLNVMNDLFDNCSEKIKDGSIGKTFEEKKNTINRVILNIENYADKITNFVNNTKYTAMVFNGLSALSVSRTVLLSDLTIMVVILNNIKINILNASIDADIIDIATLIDSNIEKLPLVRKLGV